MIRRQQKKTVGLIVGVLCREHVSQDLKNHSGPDEPTSHRTRRRSNDVSSSGAEVENPSGLDDPTPRRCNTSDYLVPATSAVRNPTATDGHRVTG